MNPNREIFCARRGQNWQLLFPMYFKFQRYFLDKPLYNYIIYPNSMSQGDNDKESKLKRYNEHEEILKQTLKQIEDTQNVDLHKYFSFIEDKYAKLRMEVAIKYHDREIFDNEYKAKQKGIGIDKIDRLNYWRIKNPIYNAIISLTCRLMKKFDIICKNLK